MSRRTKLNLTPLFARLLRTMRALDDHRAIAAHRWILAPEDETEVPPALALDGEFERIRGTHAETTLPTELERLRGGTVRHAATVAHVVRDALWCSGHVYAQGTHYRATDKRPRLISGKELIPIDQALVASSYYGGRYFGHWLTDDVPLAMCAWNLAPPIVPQREPTVHQREYLEHFGLAPRPIERAWIRELTILDDVGANASKRARWRWMRRRIRALGALGAGSNAPGAMLLRGTTGTPRPLDNQLAIADYLARRGFSILEPETMTVKQLARALHGAKLVIGVEGSQLLHGLFAMADGGAVLALQPPDRFLTTIKIYCDALGLRYSFVVGEGSLAGFHIDVDRVARTIDLALAACARAG